MRRRRTLATLTVLGLLVAGGCSSSGGEPSSDDSGDSGTAARPLQGQAGTAHPLDLTNAKLAIVLPKGFSVEGDEDTPPSDGGSTERSSVVEGDDQLASVDLVAEACSTGEPQGRQGNGDFGEYVTIDDVTDPIKPQVTQVPVGKLTIFGESRYVCTNSCKDEISTIGILELAEPSDPAYPSLMLMADADGDQRAQILDAAKRITSG